MHTTLLHSQATHLNFRPAGPHHLGESLEIWNEIQNSEANLAVWKRAVPNCSLAIQEAMEFGKVQLRLERSQPLEMLAALLDEEMDLQTPDAFDFYADILKLAAAFFEVTKAKALGLRLERLETNACSLFHVDFVGVRMITTYSGAGTLWLKNQNVMRAGLGQGSDALVQKPGTKAEVMPAGWAALMKGERSNERNGLVHKSPEIESTRGRRLILRMDTL